MSLRTRLTVLVAAVVAAAVIGGAVTSYYGTRHQLRAEVDGFLVQRVRAFDGGGVEQGPGGDRRPGPGRHDGAPPLVADDAASQRLTPDGKPTPGGTLSLPVDATDRALAAGRGATAIRLRDVQVGGTHFRLATAPLPTGGAVQLARELTETDDILAALRARLAVIVLLGTVAAAAVAWLLARRTAGPVVALTLAAEHVARTQDLSAPVPDAGRNDEIGRLAVTFNTMLAALATSREQQRRLVMDASHELRTPLTALRTNIELLARAEDLPVEQRRTLLAEATLELGELGALVAELVDLATDARTEEPVVPVDLGELAEEVATRYRRRSGRQIPVTVHEEAVIDGRPTLLDRALSNLVENALKFDDSGGPVEVVVTGRRLEVSDRGPGVSAADRPLVFDRFYRADAARARPGSGLGLAIVRQIAELHGGVASVAERTGGGSVFTLDL